MRPLRLACVVVVAIGYLAATTARVSAWQDERALWADAVRKAPKKPRPLMNLAQQLAIRNADELAAAFYTEAIALTQAPGRSSDERGRTRAVAELNLAIVRADQGDLVGALALTGAILAREPVAPLTQVLDRSWRLQLQHGTPSF